MNRRYFHKKNRDNQFVSFIESLDKEGFNKILDDVPSNIIRRNPDEFTDYDEVRVADFLSN